MANFANVYNSKQYYFFCLRTLLYFGWYKKFIEIYKSNFKGVFFTLHQNTNGFLIQIFVYHFFALKIFFNYAPCLFFPKTTIRIFFICNLVSKTSIILHIILIFKILRLKNISKILYRIGIIV